MPSHRRPAAAQRQQDLRAEGRCIQRILKCFTQLDEHRGSSNSMLGTALSVALKKQLESKQTTELVKTSLCRHYANGRCNFPHGQCNFAHGAEELGQPRPTVPYKPLNPKADVFFPQQPGTTSPATPASMHEAASPRLAVDATPPEETAEPTPGTPEREAKKDAGQVLLNTTFGEDAARVDDALTPLPEVSTVPVAFTPTAPVMPTAEQTDLAISHGDDDGCGTTVSKPLVPPPVSGDKDCSAQDFAVRQQVQDATCTITDIFRDREQPKEQLVDAGLSLDEIRDMFNAMRSTGGKAPLPEHIFVSAIELLTSDGEICRTMDGCHFTTTGDSVDLQSHGSYTAIPVSSARPGAGSTSAIQHGTSEVATKEPTVSPVIASIVKDLEYFPMAASSSSGGTGIDTNTPVDNMSNTVLDKEFLWKLYLQLAMKPQPVLLTDLAANNGLGPRELEVFLVAFPEVFLVGRLQPITVTSRYQSGITKKELIDLIRTR